MKIKVTEKSVSLDVSVDEVVALFKALAPEPEKAPAFPDVDTLAVQVWLDDEAWRLVIDQKRLLAIKRLRTMYPGLGLREAKDAVEKCAKDRGVSWRY